GNAFSATNPTPTDAFGSTSPRITSQKYGKETAFGIGGFAGVEYFVAPKISIGGEVRAALYFEGQKGGKITRASWDATASSVTTETVDNSKAKDKENYFRTEPGAAISL